MIDATLAFQLDLMRLDAHTRAVVIGILERLRKDLVSALAENPLSEFGAARATRLIRESDATIARYYAQAQGELFATADELAPVAAQATVSALQSVVPVSVSISLPTEGLLAAVAGDALVMGSAMDAWWEKQSADVSFRFAAAVRQGIVSAETNQQIIRRVLAELDITRANAAALVQTSVAQVANDARLATFAANADVVPRLKWLTALDGHVCTLCAARADLEWETDTHAPIGHSLPFASPPIHFNDRCVLVGQTRFSKLGGGQRASMDGPVDRKTTFADFLERKGPAFQDEVLGPGRADLWRSGKITLQDLVSGNGRPLTIAQLKARHN